MSLNPITWLEWIVSWLLVAFHDVLEPAFGSDSGVTWSLSIVGLVIVMRIMLIPLFVRQIRSMRNMQLIQPQVKAIQTKYAGDRERQSQELMKLYRETKTNPLASCLPILAQAPIFFALFQVLNGIGGGRARGVLTADLVQSAGEAQFFGVPLYATFIRAGQIENVEVSQTYLVTIVLIILMSATTFISQKQMIVKNTAPGNPIVQQQKILLYVFPLIFAVSGVNFPIGVLLYWFTTNVWSMGQQFWVIRNSPSPGTPAYEAWEERRRRKGKSTTRDVPGASGGDSGSGGTTTATPAPRHQPRRQPRRKRK